jgi:hypothetical protein
MLINRKVLEDIIRRGEPLFTAVNRRVGKTTGAVYSAIGTSYQLMGLFVPVNDPDVKTEAQKEWLVTAIRDVLHHNKLKNIEIVRSNGKVGLMNTFAESLKCPSERV